AGGRGGAGRAAAPDVVSVHCTRRFAPYVAVLRRATGVPHVLSLQEGAVPPGMPENPGLFRLLVRAADAVAACSAEGAAYATRVGHARRVAVVPNGFDPAEFRSGPPFPHPRPYVLGLGRLEAQKGFDLLLEALARPGAPGPDLRLPTGTPAALAAALARVVAAPDAAARLAARGRTLVEQHHPWSVVAPAYLALCAEVSGLRAARAAA